MSQKYFPNPFPDYSEGIPPITENNMVRFICQQTIELKKKCLPAKARL